MEKDGVPTFFAAGVGAVALGAVLLLTWQNLALRGRAAGVERTCSSLEQGYLWNLDLSGLEGNTLPPLWQRSLEEQQLSTSSKSLVVLYTPNVCLSCLKAGLSSLRQHRILLADAGIQPRALIGERPGTREFAAVLREDGLLDFPSTFLSVAEVQAGLPRQDPQFTETPLYLLLDRDLRIQSAFRADQQRSELLDRWLLALGP